MEPKEKNKGGRPSDYTVELGERICAELAGGKSLRQVLMAEGMPSRATVHRWLSQYTGFQETFTHAKQSAADWHADKGLAELLECRGESKEVIAWGREVAKYHMGLAKVHDPQRYGDQARLEVEHSGSVQGMGAVSINILPAQAAPVLAACAPALDVQAEKPALPDDSGERVGRG